MELQINILQLDTLLRLVQSQIKTVEVLHQAHDGVTYAPQSNWDHLDELETQLKTLLRMNRQ